jgi:hypothetical protein
MGLSAGVMKENNNLQVTSISKTDTLEEIGNYWDTHSLSEYWDRTYEVQFEVRIQQRQHVTVKRELTGCKR